MSIFNLFKKKPSDADVVPPSEKTAAADKPQQPISKPPASDQPASKPIVPISSDAAPVSPPLKEPWTPPSPGAARPPSPPREEPTKEEPKQSFFARLKQGLKKTSDFLNTDLRDLIGKEGKLVDELFLKKLFAILVRTDMGTGPAGAIRDQLQSDFRARKVHMSDLLTVARKKILELMDQPETPIQFVKNGPTVVMVVGVNGSGKTTSIAKLAHLFKSQGKRVVLGAGDTFRAAAVEQLGIWAERIGVELVKGEPGSDPASVAHRALARSIESGAEVCIIDTAGRLQTQSNLMQELGKIRRVLTKLIEAAPHEVLLVLDATAGQNGISQAKGFSDAAGCTGIVLAKLDGTAKGGVVIPIRQQFKLPVKYIGIGEKPSDIAVFNVDQFVKALFDDTVE